MRRLKREENSMSRIGLGLQLIALSFTGILLAPTLSSFLEPLWKAVDQVGVDSLPEALGAPSTVTADALPEAWETAAMASGLDGFALHATHVLAFAIICWATVRLLMRTVVGTGRAKANRLLDERVQVLAAIAHDLQTPLTRMKLRAEMAVESVERTKLFGDLEEIEHLVREGVLYARSVYGNDETNTRLNLIEFGSSLARSFEETGRFVTFSGTGEIFIDTKRLTLRRILSNLIDNALKYAGSAEVRIEKSNCGLVCIAIVDRGPGISNDQMDTVVKPFVRLSNRQGREVSGSGLGLAIAKQLTVSLGGRLEIENRAGGGLSVAVILGRRYSRYLRLAGT
jgi:signal transduction histidine kinase